MPRAKKPVEPVVPAPVAPPTDDLVLTPEEIIAIKAARVQALQPSTQPVGISEMAQALITAIEATRPPTKKNPFNRKPGDPWQAKDGSKKLKFRRAMYQHGAELNPDQLFNEEIDLLNKIKPGIYCQGVVRVSRRKDRGYDISYPVRTAQQRLRLVNEFGITSLEDLCKRILAEMADPKRYKGPDDDDDD
jgi:hypothetical protein